MQEKVTYALYRALFGAVALLPFPMLYALGSGLRILFGNVLGYRRKVIRENLRNSFPEKTDAERRQIEREFYAQFADNIVETAKLLHISDKEVDRRIRVSGAELVDRAVAQGRPVVLYIGHYGNWEWVPAITRHFHGLEICAQVYKPLRDKAFDRLMLKVRSRFGSVSVPQARVFRQLLSWHREGKRFITGFIADQRSNSEVSHHRTTFMGQPITFNPGGEEIGRRMDAVYLYLDVDKPSRGHYHLTIKEIVPQDPTEESPYTRQYMRMLEETIRRRPGLWLWSHRRWLYH